VPAHQRGQRGLVMAAEEVLQELAIGQPCSVALKHRSAKVLDDIARLAARHGVSLVPATFAVYTYYYPDAVDYCIFSQRFTLFLRFSLLCLRDTSDWKK
jgi:hypothetical protein